MKIANLDNEVHFKKVFTDIEVFKGFVKDILNIEVNIDKVETEKVLPSNTSPIKFRMDLFAEDKEQRIVIEIQKVDYDYTYDRFSHYFYANLIDLQRSSRTYTFAKDVYMIVVVTSAYKISDKNNKPIKDDVLINDTNPRTLSGQVRHMNNHKMIVLNTTYINQKTPSAIRDWLDLIAESMKDEQNFTNINRTKSAIIKAIKIAEINQLSPEELAEAKVLEMKKIAVAMREQDGFEKGEKLGFEKGEKLGVEKGKKLGLEEGEKVGLEKGKKAGEKLERDKRILKFLKRRRFSIEEIAEDFEVSIEYVKELKNRLN